MNNSLRTLLSVGLASMYVIGALLPTATFAEEVSSDVGRFRYFAPLSVPLLAAPSVVEVPFDPSRQNGYGVYDITIGEFVYSQVRTENVQAARAGFRVEVAGRDIGDILADNTSATGLTLYPEDRVISTSSEHVNVQTAVSSDGSRETTVEVRGNPIEGSRGSTAELTFSSGTPVRVDHIALQYAYASRSIDGMALYARVDGEMRLIIPQQSTDGRNVRFPSMVTDMLKLRLTYTNLVRITEIDLAAVQEVGYEARGVRFLAYPGHAYRMYVNNDQRTYAVTPGSVDMLSVDAEMGMVGGVEPNPDFGKQDDDRDGVAEGADNCPTVANTDQADTKPGGLGDACEDWDLDGVMNGVDNCPEVYTTTQIDTDVDGVGDACDFYESRLLEQYPWLPGLGIGIVGVLLAALTVATMRMKPLATHVGGQNS